MKIPQGRFDALKWAVVLCLLVAAILGNYYYANSILVARIGIVGVTMLSALLIALTTQPGRKAAAFVREAYAEIRLITWPARQEVLRVTLVVAIVTVVVALVLWGVDTIFVHLVTLITGLRF